MQATFSVTASLLELQSCVGFKNVIEGRPLIDQYGRGDHLGLCRAVADQMQLPNEIRLQAVNDISPFRTSALSPTDHHGRGTHAIVAQVPVSDRLPLYGTSAFQGFVIDIAIGQGFGTVPAETAISILAHELSHVLLYSLRHPRRDSEHVTDLVPIALGFVEIVRVGRRVQVSQHNGNQITRTTTTYGYLNDAEFREAAAVVFSALDKHREQLTILGRLLARAAWDTI